MIHVLIETNQVQMLGPFTSAKSRLRGNFLQHNIFLTFDIFLIAWSYYTYKNRLLILYGYYHISHIAHTCVAYYIHIHKVGLAACIMQDFRDDEKKTNKIATSRPFFLLFLRNLSWVILV